MREYEMETTFDVPARTFLRVVYGDDGFFFRRFHHETGECPDASVPAWNSGGMGDDAGSPSTRVVVFTKTMSLPSVIERLLGSGGAMATLRFEETQTFTWDPVTGTACIRSVPLLVSPRSESFNTEVAVYVSPDVDRPNTACAMRAVIKVTASGTWALQPVVEKLMETRASASFREWVRFADQFLEENYGGSHVGDRPLPKLRAMPGGEDDAVVHGHGRDDAERVHASGGGGATPSTAHASGADGDRRTVRRRRSSDRRISNGEDATRIGVASDSDDTFGSDDDDFDDARSVGSTSSFHSVRSAASSFGTGVGSWFSRRSGSSGGDDAGEFVDSESPAPSRTRSLPTSPETDGKTVRKRLHGSRAAGSVHTGFEPGSAGRQSSGVPKIPSPPNRQDDAFASSWFMQTVLKDLAALRAREEDTGRLLASLEENVCSVRAENAALRAEVRRVVGGGNGGGGSNGVYGSPSIRGSLRARADGKDAFDPMGPATGAWVVARWVTGLGIAVGVGVVAGQVLARNNR